MLRAPNLGMNIANKQKGEEKRAHLLQVAGEVFSEQGYQGATFREICRRANVPIASINYHFRDKRTLYLEAFRYAAQKNRERYDSEAGPKPAQSLDKLSYTINRVFHSAFDQSRPRWYSKLISRELADPSGVLDVIALEYIRPGIEELRSDLQKALSLGNDEHTARLSALCVIALVGFFADGQPMITAIYPDERFDPPSVERLVELLTRFLIVGMKSLKEPL
jgi:TetR/AcrR family transcriptional regulator, regulator of cefoperazone and chloramphenicol sensitivity